MNWKRTRSGGGWSNGMVLHTFHLFAGAGGGILADLLLGHIPVGAVEIDPYCRETLLARQADLILPRFPIWDDVRTFRSDNPECLPFIDRLRGIAGQLAICGGPPCQPFSVAGKRKASEDERDMWSETIRVIREVRPCFAFLENVYGLLSIREKFYLLILEKVSQLELCFQETSKSFTGRFIRRIYEAVGNYFFGQILGRLAEIGYDAVWTVLGATDVEAPHDRYRVWILATDSERDELRHESGRISRKNGENQTVTGNDGENRNIPDTESG